MNLKLSKNSFEKKIKTSFFRSYIEDSYLDVENIIPPNSKTAQLKQIDPITLVSNLLLYFIGTTIEYLTVMLLFII